MKKKIIQIVSSSLVAVSLLTVAALAVSPETDRVPSNSTGLGYTAQDSDYTGVGEQLMRIGIYYGSNGKSSVDLTTVTGDGFLLGYYDSDNRFVQEAETTSPDLTVQVDSSNEDTITVSDRSTGTG